MEESELGKLKLTFFGFYSKFVELVAKQILKQEGATSKESSPAQSTDLLAESTSEAVNEPINATSTEPTQIKDLFKSVVLPAPQDENVEKSDSVSPEEVESLFKRLNDQNRLSVTDSILSTTSTETPSTVRAAGDKTEITTSQEDLLTEDNTSVASGIWIQRTNQNVLSYLHKDSRFVNFKFPASKLPNTTYSLRPK